MRRKRFEAQLFAREMLGVVGELLSSPAAAASRGHTYPAGSGRIASGASPHAGPVAPGVLLKTMGVKIE